MQKFQNENKTNSENKLQQKEKTANDLIPELILKMNKCSSKLKEKIKIYSMFQEFENYAHTNLKNFIKMSDKRYQSIKSGNNLKTILRRQKKDYDELSTKIFSDNLYNDENIENEEKKLYKKINDKDVKELYQIRHDIIEKTKDLTQKELEKRQKYLILSKKSRNNSKQKNKEKNENQSSTNNSNNNKNLFQSFNKVKSFRNNKNFTFNKTMNSKMNRVFSGDSLIKNNTINDNMNKTASTNIIEQEKEFLKMKKEYFDNLLKKDYQNINDNFKEYKQFLKDIKNTKTNNLSHITNEGNNFGHTYSFNINNIKLLSFQEEKEEIARAKKKENPEINIGKLVKYTKRGNRKWFLNKIKENSRKRQNSFKFNLKFKKIENNIITANKYNSDLNIQSRENITSQEKTQNKNLYDLEEKEKEFSTFDSGGKTASTTFTNFRNTIKTVKNEAKMIQNIGKNFINKRKTMEGFFKRFNLPEIKEYEQTSEEMNNLINSQNNNKINDEISEKVNAISKKSVKLNQKLSQKNGKNQFISAKIFSDLQRTYNAKKKIWAIEDLKKENIKKEKLAHLESIKQFLEELVSFKRNPQLYVDPYSKRDNLINDRIKLFTRSLSGPFFSQKRIENKLQDFNNFIERKEKEKNIIDKKMKETLNENRQLSEEKSEFQKKLYFEKESLNEDDDINLDYKFISSLSVKKKNDRNKSYKDYKEFWDIVKYKQKTGQYNTNED